MNRSPNLVRVAAWVLVVAWLAVAAWAGGIWTLSSMTGPQVEELTPFQVSDKLLHALAFFIGGVLLMLALRATVPAGPRLRRVAFAWLALSVFGALDEWHQLHTPQRTGADVWDWAADSLGALAGALATYFWYARHRPEPSHFPAPAGD